MIIWVNDRAENGDVRGSPLGVTGAKPAKRSGAFSIRGIATAPYRSYDRFDERTRPDGLLAHSAVDSANRPKEPFTR